MERYFLVELLVPKELSPRLSFSLPPSHLLHTRPPRILPARTSIYYDYSVMMALPSNIHVSAHPCLQAKLSQLRSKATSTRETRNLVHEIATILGVEAFSTGLQVTNRGKVSMPGWNSVNRNNS